MSERNALFDKAAGTWASEYILRPKPVRNRGVKRRGGHHSRSPSPDRQQSQGHSGQQQARGHSDQGYSRGQSGSGAPRGSHHAGAPGVPTHRDPDVVKTVGNISFSYSQTSAVSKTPCPSDSFELYLKHQDSKSGRFLSDSFIEEETHLFRTQGRPRACHLHLSLKGGCRGLKDCGGYHCERSRFDRTQSEHFCPDLLNGAHCILGGSRKHHGFFHPYTQKLSPADQLKMVSPGVGSGITSQGSGGPSATDQGLPTSTLTHSKAVVNSADLAQQIAKPASRLPNPLGSTPRAADWQQAYEANLGQLFRALKANPEKIEALFTDYPELRPANGAISDDAVLASLVTRRQLHRFEAEAKLGHRFIHFPAPVYQSVGDQFWLWGMEDARVPKHQTDLLGPPFVGYPYGPAGLDSFSKYAQLFTTPGFFHSDGNFNVEFTTLLPEGAATPAQRATYDELLKSRADAAWQKASSDLTLARAGLLVQQAECDAHQQQVKAASESIPSGTPLNDPSVLQFNTMNAKLGDLRSAIHHQKIQVQHIQDELARLTPLPDRDDEIMSDAEPPANQQAATEHS